MPQLFHRHRWKVVEKTEQPSSVEVWRSDPGGRDVGLEVNSVRAFNEVTRRPVVVHYRCDCGAEKVVRV